MTTKASAILDRLTKSIDELESAIEKAGEAAREHGRDGLQGRLDSYREACCHQRELVQELKGFIQRDELDSIFPIVEKINGISALVRDDAKSVLNGNPIDERDLN